MKRRILSIVTALSMCLTLCPTWAYAAGPEPDTGLCAHHTEHTDTCGCIAPSEGQPCGHAHTDDCYITGEDGSEVLDCQHTHDSECGYTQATPGASCGYECPLCPIEALIAALPRALTEDNAETVRWQLDEILDLWRELSEDEQEQIDLSTCWDLQAELDPANALVTADGHAGQQEGDEASVDIGGSTTYYSMLEEAFSAANGNTATITMLTDAECTSNDFNNPSPLVISSGTVTLNMNGQTLSGYGSGLEGGIIGVSGGSLTIQGGGIVKVQYVGIICTGGILTVADTTFNLVGPGHGSADCAIQNGGQSKGGTVNINGGTITGNASNGQIFHYLGNTTINNVTATGTTDSNVYSVKYDNKGTLKINGGTFDSIALSDEATGISNVAGMLGDNVTYKHQGGTWATGDDLAGLSISNVTVEKIPLTINPQADTSWYYNSDAHSLQMNAVPVTEGATITYEWYDGSTKLDCTADAYPVPKTMAVGNYTYTCNATCDGYTLSHKFTFTVEACPHTGLVYESQENNKHGGTCPDCGEVVSEEHTWVDGVCSACNLKAVAQVEIGNATTYYGGIDAALTAASGKTATITLLADVTHPYMRSISDDSNNITLNGGDYTLSIQGFMVSGGQLDISSGTFKFAAALMVSGGTVRLSGGEFINTNGQEAISCMPGSNLTVGDFLLNYGSTNAAEKHYAYYQNGQPIEMTGQTSLSGTVKVDECKHDTSVREYRHNDGTQTHTLTCLACGYTEGAEDCSYGTEYKHDDTNHWQTCTVCGYENKVGHSWEFDFASSGNVIENCWVCLTCLRTKDHRTLRITVPDGLTYGNTGGKQVTYTVSPETTCDQVTWYFTDGDKSKFAGGVLPAGLAVGEHWFRVTGLSDGAVVFSGSYYLTVNPAPLTTVIDGTTTKTYDGTKDAPDGLTIKLEGIVGDDDVSATASSCTYNSADVGEATTITASGITLSGAAAKNYTLSTPTAAIPGTITKADQNTPDAPSATDENIKDTSITLNTIANTEYSKDGTTWQASAEFTGLEPNHAYTFYARLKGDSNHNPSPASAAASITTKKMMLDDATVTVSGTYTYTGAAHTPAITVVKNGKTLAAGTDYTVSYTGNINVGKATVTVTGTGDYEGSNSVTFTITPASLTADMVTLSPESVTYSGTEQVLAVIVDGLALGTDYTVSYSNNKNVGTATVTVMGKGNYTGEVEKTFSITKSTPSLTPPTASAIEYGQKLFDSTLNGGGAVNPNGNADVAGKWSWASGSTQPTESGSFAATFTPTDTANYETPADVNVNVTVNPATPEITVTAPAYQVAGGAVAVKYTVANPHDATKDDLPAVTLTYIIGDGEPQAITDGKFTIPEGTAKDTVIIISANTAAVAGKYNAKTVTATVTVTDRIPVEITGVSVTGRAYNGTAIGYTGAPVIKTLDGKTVTDAKVTYTWSGGETAPVNAGSYTLKIAVNDGKYIGETTVNFTISKATITITAANKSATVGSAQPELTYTVSGLASGDELATKPTLSCDPDMSKAGSYPITASGAAVPNTENYETEITYVAGTLTVTAKPSTNPGSSNYVPPSTSTPTLPVTTTGQNSSIVTTTTTAAPTASTSGGKATATVDTAMGNEIVKQAVANKSEEVVIAPKVTGGVTKAEVSIPASTVGQIRSQTNASLTIATPVANVTIPNGGLGSLSGTSGTVTVTAEKTGNHVELIVTAGGRTVESIPGGVTLTVPVSYTTPGTVAVLVHDNGTREVVRKSVADNGSVTIPLDGSAKLEIVDNSKYFADVPSTSWAADAVAFASSHELFNGTSATQFSPDQPMSRGMLAVVLHNLESNPAQALSGVFADVNSSEWYAQGVAWAASTGVVGGYGNGQFGPNDNITREQLVVMLWRYAGSPAATDEQLHFADAYRASDWALDALRWATQSRIINGKGNGILDPTGNATRAETAQMLKNFFDNR